MDNTDFETSINQLVNKKQTAIKALSGTVSKNFFSFQDIQDQDNLQSISPTKILNYEDGKDSNSPVKKLKISQRNIKLKPIGNATPEIIQLHQTKNEYLNPEKKQDKRNPLKQEKNEENYNLQNKRRLNFQIQSSDQQVQQQPFEITNKNQRENEIKNNVQMIEDNQQQIARQNIQATQRQERNHQNQEINQEISPRTTNEQMIKIRNPIIFIMKRDQQWLNKIWPQFNLHYKTNNQYYISAKMTGNNASTTFVMCSSKTNFMENGDCYFGKIKANFIGNQINVYGPGYNPSDHKAKRLALREVLATIEYETNFFGSTRPRNFKVFALKKGTNYYKDLVGPIPSQEQIPLSKLYQREENKNKIIVMQNRKPKWNEKINGFMLNFGGRIKKASIKNFILQDVDNPEIVRLIFGKLENDEFRLDIGQQLSAIVGFGIALSTFGGKIGCQ